MQPLFRRSISRRNSSSEDRPRSAISASILLSRASNSSSLMSSVQPCFASLCERAVRNPRACCFGLLPAWRRLRPSRNPALHGTACTGCRVPEHRSRAAHDRTSASVVPGLEDLIGRLEHPLGASLGNRFRPASLVPQLDVSPTSFAPGKPSASRQTSATASASTSRRLRGVMSESLSPASASAV